MEGGNWIADVVSVTPSTVCNRYPTKKDATQQQLENVDVFGGTAKQGLLCFKNVRTGCWVLMCTFPKTLHLKIEIC